MQMLEWARDDISNVAGELSLLSGLVMWATTYPGIRRKMFELFLYTHYLYILFMVFFIFHVGISFACLMLPGFYLFLVDRFLRFLQSRQRVRLVSARILPCDTVELNFSKNPSEINYQNLYFFVLVNRVEFFIFFFFFNLFSDLYCQGWVIIPRAFCLSMCLAFLACSGILLPSLLIAIWSLKSWVFSLRVVEVGPRSYTRCFLHLLQLIVLRSQLKDHMDLLQHIF